MMKLSLPLLLCQCVILLVSLEGIVCPLLLDFVVENFSTAEVYTRVIVQGNNRTGRFIFRKDFGNNAAGVPVPDHVIRIPDILRSSLKIEENCRKIVSFCVRGTSANYFLKFKTDPQAFVFATYRALPSHFKIFWVRVYTDLQPAIIAYDKFDTGDIGFKLLDNGDYTDEYEHLRRLPYVFKRSEIKNEIWMRPPRTLYLRNKARVEDYKIVFLNTQNLDTFLNFFPDKIYDEYRTQSYYYLPQPWLKTHYNDPSESSRPRSESSRPRSESSRLSESHHTSE